MRVRLPSPAMVVALIALGVALGGVGYAAVSLPPRSVTTRELANGSVTSAKVKDGALLARDFRAGQLPAGPPGPPGPQGPPGSGSVLSATANAAFGSGRVLFKDDGTGAEIRTGSYGQARFVNTSDDTKLDVRGLVYYGQTVYPVTFTLGPGQQRDVGAETVSLTFGTFLLTRDVVGTPRLTLTCGYKDSGTSALVRLSCVGVR